MMRKQLYILIGVCLLLLACAGSWKHLFAVSVRPDIVSSYHMDIAAAGDEADAVRFAAIHLYIDTDQEPLAAWQIRLRSSRGQVEIVGIVGGDHPIYQEPAYYDPRAIQQERVIIADFSTAPADELPSTLTRIASVNVMITGNETPRIHAALTAAADPDGKRIPARLTLIEGSSE